MKSHRKILIAFFSLLILNKTASAKNLTWNEAVLLTQKNNSELIASQKSFLSTKATQNTSYSGYLPRLSASLSETQSKTEATDTATNYAAQLNLSLNIFSGFLDLNKSKMYEANTSVAEANLRASLAAVSAELRTTFVNFIFSKIFKKLTADIIFRRKENLKNVQLQFQSGRENKGSVLLSEAYVEQAMLDDLSASHDFEVSIEILKRTLGLKSTDEIEISEEDQMTFLTEIRQKPLEKPDYLKLAKTNPDVLALQFQNKASMYSYQMSQSQFYPSLDLSGSYGNYDTSFFPEKNKWSVSLTLSFPLFDGARDYYTVKSNYLKYESTLLQANDKLIQIQTKLKKTYQDYIESIQKEKVDLSFNHAADVRAQIARSKYKNGLMSFDDWDLVETDLIQKQKSYLNSVKDRVTKLSLWEQAQGIGVLDENK
jgi:outer membrane protein TolC